jgi:hypothetical protein
MVAIDWLSRLFEMMTTRRLPRCFHCAPWRVDQRPPLVAREITRMQVVAFTC